MFGQLGLAITQVSIDASYLSVLSLVLVLLIWAHTFLFFAPSHGKIAANNITKDFIQKIVRINWWRTFLWSIVFLLSFTQFQL